MALNIRQSLTIGSYAVQRFQKNGQKEQANELLRQLQERHGTNPILDQLQKELVSNNPPGILEQMEEKSLKMKPVFISYINEDFEKVNMLSNELKKNGIEVWLDKEKIQPGADWHIAIEDAIRNGAYFIACFSENSCKPGKKYMYEELQIAIEQLRKLPDDEIWFIPIKLSVCEIPRFEIRNGKLLDSKQWVDLSNNWQSGINRIVKVISNGEKLLP